MGSSGSKQQQHAVTKSPSAAFGRLTIHSPRITQVVQKNLKHSRSLRSLPPGEASPLILQTLGTTSSSTVSGDFSNAGSISNISPPLLLWIGPALVCAFAYALYNIFIKKGSSSIHPVLGGVILQFVAAILGSILLTVLVINMDGGVQDLPYDREGIQWAVCAGIAVGSAEILSFIVSGMGVQAMQSIPIIIGGSVLFGTVMGATVLQEMLTYRGWLGVGLIAAGISLVGIDPGGAGSVH
jgi:transporter family protein